MAEDGIGRRPDLTAPDLTKAAMRLHEARHRLVWDIIIRTGQSPDAVLSEARQMSGPTSPLGMDDALEELSVRARVRDRQPQLRGGAEKGVV